MAYYKKQGQEPIKIPTKIAFGAGAKSTAQTIKSNTTVAGLATTIGLEENSNRPFSVRYKKVDYSGTLFKNENQPYRLYAFKHNVSNDGTETFIVATINKDVADTTPLIDVLTQRLVNGVTYIKYKVPAASQITSWENKIDRVANATNNNIPILDENGNLKDSGKSLNDTGKLDSISLDGVPQAIDANKNVDLKVYTKAETDTKIDKAGHKIALEIDNSNFKIKVKLFDKNNNLISISDEIDLPLESVVVSGTYNSTTKKVVLTLQDNSTIEFSVADLISGLQSEITSSNKLDADLVDDSNSINKFVTSEEKQTWNAKSDFKGYSVYDKLPSSFVDDYNSINKFVTNEEKQTWNNKSDFKGYSDSNKLTSNLVDDSNSVNKFVTNEEKQRWNNKSDFKGYSSSDKLSSDLVDDSNSINKFVTSEEKQAWNAKSDFKGYSSSDKLPGEYIDNTQGWTSDVGLIIIEDPEQNHFGTLTEEQIAVLSKHHILLKYKEGSESSYVSYYFKESSAEIFVFENLNLYPVNTRVVQKQITVRKYSDRVQWSLENVTVYYQNKLIGTETIGQNLKTVNGMTLLGAGNIDIIPATITDAEIDEICVWE